MNMYKNSCIEALSFVIDLELDPAHEAIDLLAQQVSYDVWDSKYRYKNEADLNTTIERVCKGLFKKISSKYDFAAINSSEFMKAGLLIPAGRILAGAGTDKRVTLNNCFVSENIKDSMQGIMSANTNMALTLQQGGGDGLPFGTIRPKGAILRKIGDGAEASGPIPFIQMMDATGKTIMSAGWRRCALMGTITDTHPDLLDFIKLKHTAGVATSFNLSILITDAFMQAVKDDADWHLYFNVPPRNNPQTLKFQLEGSNEWQYVYSSHKARDLWDIIMRSTYEYSEPGIIFIDRVNDKNNLQYCETITATNPCGEQPLPPNGTCNLAAVNLARMISEPFTSRATFQIDLFMQAVSLGIFTLDCVIDASAYPLPSQKKEQLAKRRLGLGITGLGDALAMLDIPYGSQEAIDFADRVGSIMANQAYYTSLHLGSDLGPFPAFDSKNYEIKIPINPSLKRIIKQTGPRNGILLTIAPTGSISCVFGYVNGGMEPAFANIQHRKVLQPNDKHKSYISLTYAAQVYRNHVKGTPKELPDDQAIIDIFNTPELTQREAKVALDFFPKSMNEATDVSPYDHVRMQAALQKWIDASISKTVNLDENIPFEDMKDLYLFAYESGCKGTTTYRPSEVRGSVLEVAGSKKEGKSKEEHLIALPRLKERPSILRGHTYKIKWPSLTSSVYITINDTDDGKPYEVFISSKDARYQDWTAALTVMISAIFRTNEDPTFVANELMQVQSMHDGSWLSGKYYGSLIAYIGEVIHTHLNKAQPVDTDEIPAKEKIKGSVCPQCSAPALIHQEGCAKCTQCDYSRCS